MGDTFCIRVCEYVIVWLLREKKTAFPKHSSMFNIKTDEVLIGVKLPNSSGIFYCCPRHLDFLLHLQILNSWIIEPYRPHPNGAIDFIIYFPALQ